MSKKKWKLIMVALGLFTAFNIVDFIVRGSHSLYSYAALFINAGAIYLVVKGRNNPL